MRCIKHQQVHVRQRRSDGCLCQCYKIQWKLYWFLGFFQIAVMCICFFVILPLNLVGTVLGRNIAGQPNYPCRINAVPRPIPEKKWYSWKITCRNVIMSLSKNVKIWDLVICIFRIFKNKINRHWYYFLKPLLPTVALPHSHFFGPTESFPPHFPLIFVVSGSWSQQ